jgi:hypothetical protein
MQELSRRIVFDKKEINECSVEKADRMGYQTMGMNLNSKAWKNDALVHR